MPVPHQHPTVFLLEAVDEIRGLTSEDDRQSSLAAGRESPRPLKSYRRAEIVTKQYSQTATLGKGEGDVAEKKKPFKVETATRRRISFEADSGSASIASISRAEKVGL